MTTLALKVDVDDSALGRLKTSVRDLSTSFKSLQSEVGQSGSASIKAAALETETALKAVKSSTQALSRSAKQVTDDYSKGFGSLLPVLDKIASNLDRVASSMERLSERNTRAMRAQKQATAEVVAETEKLTRAENTLASAQARTATRAGAKKATQSLSAADPSTGYRYTLSSKVDSNVAAAAISALREEAAMRKRGLEQIQAAMLDEQRTRSLGLAQIKAAQMDEQQTRSLALAQIKAAQMDEQQTRSLALAQIKAAQMDERQTRSLALAQIKAVQMEEQATRKLALAQIKAAQMDEQAVRKLGLLQLKAAQMAEGAERKLALDQIAAAQIEEKRTRNLGLTQIRAAEENERRTRKRGLEQVAAQLEEERRTRSAQNAKMKALVANDRYADMGEKGQVRTQMRVLRGIEAGKTVDELSGLYGERALLDATGQSIDGLRSRYAELSKTKVTATGETKKFTEAQHALHSALRGVGGGLDNLWLTYGKYASAMAAAYAATSAVRQSFTKGIEFEYQTHYTSVISNEGYSEQNVEKIRDGLMKVSDMKGVYHSALELSKGMRIMQQAGLDASVALGAIGTASKVASLSETDLKTASEDLISVLEIFNMKSKDPEVLAENFKRAGDVMAYVSNATSANMHEVAESFKNLIGVSEAYGITLEAAAALTEQFAQAGVKGSKAGTFSRNFLDELLGLGTKRTQDLRQRLGMEQFNKETENAVEYIGKFIAKAKALDSLELSKVMESFFGERGQRQARLFIGDIETLADKMGRVEEKAKGMTDELTRLLGLDTSVLFKEVGNDLEAALIEAFRGSGPVLQDLAKTLSEVFKSKDFRDGLQSIVSNLAEFAKWVVTADNSLVVLGGSLLAVRSVMKGGIVAKLAGDFLGLSNNTKGTGDALSRVLRTMTDIAGPAAVLSTMGSSAERAAGSVGRLATNFGAVGDKLLWLVTILSRHPILLALMAAGGVAAYVSKLEAQRENWVPDATSRLAGSLKLPETAGGREALKTPEIDSALKALDEREAVLSKAPVGAREAVLAPINTLRKELQTLKDSRYEMVGPPVPEPGDRIPRGTGTLPGGDEGRKDTEAAREAVEQLRTALEGLKTAQQDALDDLSRRFESLAAGPLQTYQDKVAAINASYAAMQETIDKGKNNPLLRGSDKARLERDAEKLEGDRLKALRAEEKNYEKIVVDRAKKLEKLELEAGTRVLSAQEVWLREYAAEYGESVTQLQTDAEYLQGQLKQAQQQMASATTLDEFLTASQNADALSTALENTNEQLDLVAENVGINVWAEGVKEALRKAADEIDGLWDGLQEISEKSSDEGLLGILGGNAQDFERQRTKLKQRIESALDVARRDLEKGKGTALEAELRLKVGSIEKDLREADKAVDPTLERWGNSFGDYIAEALVYGFDQGESPVKAFTNMLKQELYKSLAQALSRQFSLGLSGIFGDRQSGSGGQAAGTTGGSGGFGFPGGGSLLSSGLMSAGAALGYSTAAGGFMGSLGAGMSTFGSLSATSGALSAASASWSAGAYASSAGYAIGAVAPYALAAVAALQVLGVFDKKPSDKTAWASVDPTDGRTFDVGGMTGKKDPGQEAKDNTASLAALMGSFAKLVGISDTITAMTGGRDGMRLRINREEGTHGFLTPLGSVANGNNSMNFGSGDDAIKLMLEDIIDEGTLPLETIERWKAMREDTRGVSRDASELISVLGLITSGYSDAAIERGNLVQAEGELLDAAVARVEAIEKALSGTALPGDQLAKTVSDLVKGFEHLGFTMPSSKEALNGLIAGLDTTTEEGRAAYQAAMGLAEGYLMLGATQEEMYNSLLTDEQRLSNAQKELSDAFGLLNLEVPKNRDGLLELLGTFDRTTESGASLYAQVLSLGAGFLDAAAAAKQLEDQRKGSYRKLLSDEEQLALDGKSLTAEFEKLGYTLPKSKDQLRGWIDALNNSADVAGSEKERLQKIAEAYDKTFGGSTGFEKFINSAGQTEEEARNTANGLIALIEATLDYQAALDKSTEAARNAREEATRAYTATALDRRTEAIESLRSPDELAARDARQLADRSRGLTYSFEKLGFALPKSIEELRGFFEQIGGLPNWASTGPTTENALLDLVAPFIEYTALKDKVLGKDEATSSEDAIERARDNLRAAYDDQVSSLENTRDAMKDLVASLKDFRKSLLLGDNSPLNPLEKYNLAREEFETTSALAATGDEDALARLQSVSSEFLDASRQMYASGEEYNNDFSRVLDALDAAGTAAEIEQTLAEQSLKQLETQVGALIDINSSVMSVEQAIRELVELTGGISTGGVGNFVSDSYIGKAYQTVLGRAADDGGLAYWKQQLVSGAVSPENFNQALAEGALNFDISSYKGDVPVSTLDSSQKNALAWLRANGVPGYANGGMHSGGIRVVGERGWELEAAGPARYWSHTQTKQMLQGGSPELVQEVRALKAEVVALRQQQAEEHQVAVSTNYDANLQAASRLAEANERMDRQRRAAERFT